MRNLISFIFALFALGVSFPLHSNNSVVIASYNLSGSYSNVKSLFAEWCYYQDVPTNQNINIIDSIGGKAYIRVNYVGYLPTSKKVAVYIKEKSFSSEKVNVDKKVQNYIAPSSQVAWKKSISINNESKIEITNEIRGGENEEFIVRDARTNEVVLTAYAKKVNPSKWGLEEAYRLDFTNLNSSGGYYLEFKGVQSPAIRIAPDVYDGAADILLYYMRSQQCGYNPFVDTLCHQKDGYIVDHPTLNGTHIDVRGGWHDASDYLQYLPTSATATYQMLFAYKFIEDKSIFKDNFDAMGKRGANGIADLLDQAKWGLDWLQKMNPDNKVMFNQIADDRDHIGFKPPQFDTADYGWGEGNGRPVYFITGLPQGMGKFGKNRTTGVASSAGKFASAFALGAEIFKSDNKFSKNLIKKAQQAYNFAKEFPGNTQTACYVSRYFYEEDTWVDDVELAAASLYELTEGENYLQEADYYGEQEPITPWMELGRGRHYQYYPFINLGHFLLAHSGDSEFSNKYKALIREGLVHLYNRGYDDPFLHGVPYLWCSNNLTSAAVTQATLYRKLTGDNSFLEMESALRDWLFGCNPWGVSMIVGYPKGGVLPTDPHSAFTNYNKEITGGLIDGPVYKFIFDSRAGQSLRKGDQTPYLNNGIAVYHNDIGDYSTNEPTMDGTASLVYYLATLEEEGNRQKKQDTTYLLNGEKDNYGAIRRIDKNRTEIYLIFSADSLFNGGESVLKTLSHYGIKASFFFTGNALRMAEHKDIISRIIADGHYVGGHSNNHILYAPWSGSARDSLLVTPDSLIADLKANSLELQKFGISPQDSKWFLPPYEHYNKAAVNLIERSGYSVINYTSGTATPADYTTPSMPNYKRSKELIDRLFEYESKHNLNGAIILIHPGVDESRPNSERLYNKLKEIIVYLQDKGYTFNSLKDVPKNK